LEYTRIVLHSAGYQVDKAISAADSVGLEEEIMRAIDCFLTMPVSPDELLSTIDRYLLERG